MLAIIATFVTIASMFATAAVSMAGFSYYTVGYGLHPAIAGFGVLLFVAVGVWAIGILAEECGE